ncbi:hypothetical protein [Aquimarina litoralis]|uniref:hypothetical protein n=1 Tax=Aquimarina litoralis TaxID=584605 RepID=UPI001C5A3746|nr:hypothetical protein [Aquimarina litoralis]MBW1296014.1 hypothetical protein [Aquimarina litoralis]
MRIQLRCTLWILLISILGYSQTPQGFNYQSVVRDAAGNIVASTTIGVEFKLHQTTADGTVVYTETHTPTTNAYGVFDLIVGQGTTTDDFSTINWSSGSYFLEVSVDTAGGSSYKSMGTTQLLSVPYALQAKYVENGDDLGNHTLTENLKIGGNWISNDGDDEGLLIGDAGRVTTSNKLFLGSNINLATHWINGDGTDNKGIQFDTNGNVTASGKVSIGGNLQLNDNWISNDGDNEGIKILDNGTIELTGNIKLADNWINNDGGEEGLQFDTDGNVTSSGNITLGDNLLLNNNWLSNDGGDEGIRIADDGVVVFGGNLRLNNKWFSNDGGDEGIAIDDAGNVTSSGELAVGGNIKLNNNWLSNDGGDEGLQIDNTGNITTSGNLTSTGNIEFGGLLTSPTENQIFGSYDDTSNLSNLTRRNVVIGHQAAEGAQSGDGNVVLGYFAGYNLNGDSNVLIGTAAGAGGSFSNQLHIRNLIYGEFDNDYLEVNGELKVDENIATDGNVIIDQDGDDLRAAGASNNVEMISLIIAADGSINGNVTGSSGITTSLSDETYTINYNNHFSDIPAVTITCLSTTSRTRIGQIITLGQGKVTYKVKSENNNSETDAMTIVNIVGRR